MNDKQKKTSLSRIKSSIFERSMAVAKIGISTGLKYAATKTLGKDTNQFYTDQAGLIVSELGQLKGSLMKAGQMLSMYGEYFFPPAANAILKQLQSDSPPLDWAHMNPRIQSLLNEEQLDQLDINPVSIGTASMGQVHSAILKGKHPRAGKKIALKIQYPDVDLAIDSDISALKRLLKVSKLLPSQIDLDPVMQEIKEMLRQELDYEFELKQTAKYKELVATIDPEGLAFAVPEIYPEFSNSRVLATEYMEGLKADHPLVQNLSQARRNRLAENFLRLYQSELFTWNLVQTDPHLGNYKIQIDPRGNDRIVLLDFGATKSFPLEFMNSYRRMIKGSIQRDLPMFHQASRELGFIQDSDSKEYLEVFTDFCLQTVEPFMKPEDPRNSAGKVNAKGEYHWKDTDLPTRVVKQAVQFRNFDLRSPPKDILFLDRKTGGVFIFLSILKAHINGRKIVDPFLDQI